MKRVYDFLKEAKVYYLATMDGDQARVRPFGTIDLFDSKLYIMTKNRKKVSDQMKVNPKVELTAIQLFSLAKTLSKAVWLKSRSPCIIMISSSNWSLAQYIE